MTTATTTAAQSPFENALQRIMERIRAFQTRSRDSFRPVWLKPLTTDIWYNHCFDDTGLTAHTRDRLSRRAPFTPCSVCGQTTARADQQYADYVISIHWSWSAFQDHPHTINGSLFHFGYEHVACVRLVSKRNEARFHSVGPICKYGCRDELARRIRALDDVRLVVPLVKSRGPLK